MVADANALFVQIHVPERALSLGVKRYMHESAPSKDEYYFTSLVMLGKMQASVAQQHCMSREDRLGLIQTQLSTLRVEYDKITVCRCRMRMRMSHSHYVAVACRICRMTATAWMFVCDFP